MLTQPARGGVPHASLPALAPAPPRPLILLASVPHPPPQSGRWTAAGHPLARPQSQPLLLGDGRLPVL